ncbi:MAG: hypothetical protein ACHQAX_08260 [Gammaproteobacteria bacterium]
MHIGWQPPKHSMSAAIRLELDDFLSCIESTPNKLKLKEKKVLDLNNIGLGSPSLCDIEFPSQAASVAIIRLIHEMPSLKLVTITNNPELAPEAILEIHLAVNNINLKRNKPNWIEIQSDFVYMAPQYNLTNFAFENKEFTFASILFYLLRWKLSERSMTMFEIISDHLSKHLDHYAAIQPMLNRILTIENRAGHMALQISAEIENPAILHVFCNQIHNPKHFCESLVYLGLNKCVEVSPKEYVPRVVAALRERKDFSESILSDLGRNLQIQPIKQDKQRLKLT